MKDLFGRAPAALLLLNFSEGLVLCILPGRCKSGRAQSKPLFRPVEYLQELEPLLVWALEETLNFHAEIFFFRGRTLEVFLQFLKGVGKGFELGKLGVLGFLKVPS